MDFRLDLRQAAPAPLFERRPNQPDDGREHDGGGGERCQSPKDPGEQLDSLIARPVIVVEPDPDAFEVIRGILGNLGVLREEIAKLRIGRQVTVAAHQGRIELRPSAGGSGACFVVALPRAAETTARDEAAAPKPADAKPLAGRRVLVAEDEPLVRDLFSRLLAQDGATVTLAHDGEEAWTRILETDFDLIVADLRMPNLDGRGLYERLVEEKPSMVRRFVFATGDLVRQESLRFLEGLPNRILAKPLDVENVRRVLLQVVTATRPA